MNRILTALLASATLLTLSAPGFAESKHKAPAPHMMPAGNHTCPRGTKYVKTYKKANGKKVKGYCRKA